MTFCDSVMDLLNVETILIYIAFTGKWPIVDFVCRKLSITDWVDVIITVTVVTAIIKINEL